jgi:hypothetical protein
MLSIEEKRIRNAESHRRRYKANIEANRAKDRAKYHAHKDQRREVKKEYAKLHTEANRKATGKYKKKHPEKCGAHVAIYRAVKRGTIMPAPCEVCSAQNSQAHHPDYKQKLNVMWLCPQHHRDVHSGRGRHDNTSCG